MRQRRSSGPRLQFESLENRRLMAADVIEREFNDRQNAANVFTLPTTGSVALVGQSRSHDDKDFFLFQAPVSGKVNLSVAATGAAAQAEIEDRFSNDIFETEPNDGVNWGTFTIEAGKWYFVRLRSVSSRASDYRAVLSVQTDGSASNPTAPANPTTPANPRPTAPTTPAPGGPATPAPSNPADTFTERETNNERRLANAIDLGSDGGLALRGTADQRDRDFFLFTAATSGTLRVDVRSLNGSAAKVTIQDVRQRDLFETEPNDGVNGGSVAVQAGSQYLVRVRGTDRAVADYEVSLRLQPASGAPSASASTSTATNAATNTISQQDVRQEDRREDRLEDRDEDRREDRSGRDDVVAARDVLFAQIGSRRGRR